MKKIENFNGISKYFCTKHNHYHPKIRNNKACKPFKECKEFGVILTYSEAFKIGFIKNWEYQIKHPKKEINISTMFINE